ncbi:LOB domain-containing protein 5 [Arabidopsis thaliana]|uniref:LBD5 n=1 Tax=Arabidopsis thaliana TaxID=3702 RepID=A0A178WK74_ARATH|nr:LBD5 [Arabidopsis thaliana]
MEPLGNRRPCSVCITKNRNCPRFCEYAEYFPYELQSQYESANELFGTPNIIMMMQHAPEEKKQMLATSIIMEGNAWTEDPISGGFGMIQKLMWKIMLHKAYLRELQEKIKEEKEKKPASSLY